MRVQVSDCTLHLIPDPKTLSRTHHDFASQYVADEVLANLLRCFPSELEDFLSSSWAYHELAHVRRRLFKSYVHRVLPLGGDYELRDLQSGVLSGNICLSHHVSSMNMQRAPVIPSCT